jgi:non-ribosomal peptide synthetase component E (peptide arylation enzyme)
MLHHLLNTALEIDPDRPVLECDGAWTTTAELERLAARLASGLAALGLEEGDWVAHLLPNCLEQVVCYLACFRMRLVTVPLDYQYHPLQVGDALGHSGASILVVDHERIPGLEEAAALSAAPRVVVVGDGSATAGRRPPAKTFLTLTPAGLGQLMASPDFQTCDFSRLRLCLAGGDRVPTRRSGNPAGSGFPIPSAARRPTPMSSCRRAARPDRRSC